MNYFSAFDISMTGMEVQKLRVDTVAMNLANVNTTRTPAGGPYKPLEVVVSQRLSNSFNAQLDSYDSLYRGVQISDVRETLVQPKLVHQPAHPDADVDGMVAYPNINPVSEMVSLLEATRAYEANVKAINAAKTMAMRALEIGER